MSDVGTSGATMIVGAGTMGVGIAAIYTVAGREVVLVEPDSAVRNRAHDRVSALVEELTGARSESRLSLVGDIDSAVRVEFVIEAVPEVLELKRRVYRRLFDVLALDALVASNTSSILPDELTAELAADRAARFAISHYWHPPHRLPLVEIVPGSRTAPSTTETLRTIVMETGSHPIVLKRAIPGFIGNRIQRSANSHTGPQLHRWIRGRTDRSIRLRAALHQKSLASRGASTDEYTL
jgi:3-hydroxybutyryl-CoA dehydrogenase